ncbi:uncharacterized protein LOC122320765 [Drosophila ficusphila]|uniref:uncharacterized protein LOC122320765 n=1 Tax=Drosophila ficusphila TaxID=30025 RepID=UPI001C8A047A|nr:uncharacterized protein LOC122320765 [Drosophila ficusphila]
MPLVRSTENLVSLESEEEIGICLICNVTIASADLHETGCKHSFHVACIQNWLRTDSNCPTCSKSIGSQSDPGASSNSHRMTTRSNSRALMANANANQQDSQSIPQQRTEQVTSQNSSDVDESRIQQLISRAFERFHAQLSMDITNQITDAFQQLNESTMGASNQRVGHQVQRNNSAHAAHPSNPVGSEGTLTSGRSGRSPHSDLSIDRPDKISNTISNWRIKFSDSPSDITIECENNDEEHSVDDNSTVDEVRAIKVAEKLTCWNCDAKGHRYHDCRKPRRIFCYGCGTPDTYKPDCAKCASASENSKADVRLVSKRDIRH